MHAATIRERLLFLSLSSRCGYYLKVATIQGVASIRINTVHVSTGGFLIRVIYVGLALACPKYIDVDLVL